MEQPSDEVLIEKSRDGDMAAFKTLVIRHEGKVAGVIRSMLGTIPEAEDVGQEVFIRFYDALGKFRGDSQVSTYLVRIAINLSLNELKRKKRDSSRYIPIEAAAGKGTENTMDLNEQLHYEFSRLDPDFQAVATLRLIEGYSTEETAQLLGIPLGTVLSRLARAQQKLRVALSKKLK
jgi:RNA polymerase sigma-70 factor, ECF subfamily